MVRSSTVRGAKGIRLTVPQGTGQGRRKVMRQQQQTAQQQQRPQQTRPQTQAQGQSQPALEFFHQSGEGKFKKLTLSVSERGGVIIRLSEKEGDALKSIVFSLNRTELITLSKEIELFLMGVSSPTPANGSGRASVVEFFHYNNDGQYKKLSVEVFGDGGLALVLRQGEKGTPADGIVFSLSRGEAIHLQEELKLLFYKGL
jgi:hypothetical protein